MSIDSRTRVKRIGYVVVFTMTTIKSEKYIPTIFKNISLMIASYIHRAQLETMGTFLVLVANSGGFLSYGIFHGHIFSCANVWNK